SVALANLERELGFRLFQRRRGFFAPTDEALLLHAEAERGLIALDQVRRRATAIRAGAIGGLTVATNGVAAVNLLPRLIADFCENHPGIQVDLRIRSSRRIASLVSEGQADIGLIDAPVPVAGLESRIFRLPCVCILREDDPLSAEPVIRPDLLAGRPIIGITGDHPLDRSIDGLLADAGIVAERQVSGAYFAIIRSLVAAGAGIALVDVINGIAPLSDGVVWRPFEPKLSFDLAVIVAASHGQNTALSPAGQEFLVGLHEALAGDAKRDIHCATTELARDSEETR
ncbi:MAG: LysR substrate-binding domain-containing protein, partial [Pseudomonadota bacterium]